MSNDNTKNEMTDEERFQYNQALKALAEEHKKDAAVLCDRVLDNTNRQIYDVLKAPAPITLVEFKQWKRTKVQYVVVSNLLTCPD
jgi:hypothetical protein